MFKAVSSLLMQHIYLHHVSITPQRWDYGFTTSARTLAEPRIKPAQLSDQQLLPLACRLLDIPTVNKGSSMYFIPVIQSKHRVSEGGFSSPRS